MIPTELINKIIMMSRPKYDYIDELKKIRICFNNCNCEGCKFKPYYGCYYFDSFNDYSSKRGCRKYMIFSKLLSY